MLTRNRRQWLPKAIAKFQQQTYPNKELLIIADGEDVRDLIPNDACIRLFHIEEGYSIGAKRNFGCDQANGSIIAHWDDDDLSHPDRLSDQVTRLNDKAVAGYRSMYFTNGSDWWLFEHISNCAIGTSLAYRKSWWATHHFPALQVGEDSQFSKAARESGELITVDAGYMLVASIHPGNTSPRQLTQEEGWRRVARPDRVGNPFQ